MITKKKTETKEINKYQIKHKIRTKQINNTKSKQIRKNQIKRTKSKQSK